MPTLRRGVNRAIARRATALKKYDKEFYDLNPGWKGHEAEAKEDTWASEPPSMKAINRYTKSKDSYESAMQRRARMGKLRLMLNPEAAKRLKRIQDARLKRIWDTKKALK